MKNVSLYVNSKELAHIYGEKVEPKDFKSLGIKPDKPEGYYSIESKEFCRQFDADTCKCLSYNKRPKSCREFPFVVEKDALVIKSGCSLNRGGSEFKKLAQIASAYGKVIVKRAGK
jgi:Fe-S-cluster containining protein